MFIDKDISLLITIMLMNAKSLHFRKDSKLLYRESQDDMPLVFFIPPHVKKDIVQGLERLGISDDFIYPELDTVFTSINKEIKNENSEKT